MEEDILEGQPVIQLYTAAFDPKGPMGVVDHVDWLTWLGAGGVVGSPVNKWNPGSKDGPYSPLAHDQVDERSGGEKGVIAVNRGLSEAGIVPIGDLVLNHADERSWLVGQVERDPASWASWFRVTADSHVADNWADKTSVFGLPNRLWEERLKMWRASSFYPEQWEFNFGQQGPVEYMCSVAELMITKWGYKGLRQDAIGYAAATALLTLTGQNEPAGLELAAAIRRRLSGIHIDGSRPFTIAEAGGTIREVSAWLLSCDYAYDFSWMPALIESLDEGNWLPLRRYWQSLPTRWRRRGLIRFLGSHDERQGRYHEYGAELIERHGGPGGVYACFDGHGLTLPVRNLVPSERAFVTVVGLTVLSDGQPLLYQTDIGGWRGDVHANERDVRDPNRCLMPWDSRLPRAGWPEDAPYRLEPTWRTRSVYDQMGDPGSVMSRIRRIIALRRGFPAVRYGDMIHMRTPPEVEVFARVLDEANPLLVLANASPEPRTVYVDDLSPRWRGRRLRRLETAPAAYSPNGPTLVWQRKTSLIGLGEHRFDLPPYALEVLEVVP